MHLNSAQGWGGGGVEDNGKYRAGGVKKALENPVVGVIRDQIKIEGMVCD